MKFKRKKINEKGQFTYVILFVFLFFILLIAFAVIAPLMQNLSSGFYVAMQPTVALTSDNIDQITDANMRTSMQGVISAQQTYQALNIQTLGTMAAFSGIIIIIIVAIVWFLIARRNVESGGMG